MPPQDQPQQMYYSRPLEPQRPIMTEAVQKKSEESRKKYPHINLSQGEYVINDVKRHPIGLIKVWGMVVGLVLVIMVLLGVVVRASTQSGNESLPVLPLAVVAGLLALLVVIGGYIATYVYNANKFYLTNESVIQNIQMSLFSNREQTVSLGNVEDASYVKNGVIQAMFDYGVIRLSTQGDETTYRFSYAAHPAKQVAKLNDAVEAFKNGRPVNDDDDE
jgi:uncharacterized membrane protein YdbT with pleckstrin-like domain